MDRLMMKRCLRDAAIHTGAVISRFVNADKGGRIIALHDVPDAALFRGKLEWLLSHYNVVSLEALLSKDYDGGQKRVAITFDDGYANWLENVTPVLEELQVPAVFFVCSGILGLKGRVAQEFIRNRLLRRQQLELISCENLKNLAENPLFEIGGHTCDHVNLGKIADLDELNRQIDTDKQQLTNWTGRTIRWFAYPFGGHGNWNKRVQDIVRSCDYKAAFTILPGCYKTFNDQYAIVRDCLDLDAPEKLWKDWLDGGYDMFTGMKRYI